MQPSRASKQTFVFVVAAALVTGCSAGTQSSIAPSGTLTETTVGQAIRGAVSPTGIAGVTRTTKSGGKSWTNMSKNGKASLLYVTNTSSGTVNFYTYNNGKGSLAQQGSISGFTYPAQPCTDASGNVFIPDYTLGTVTEFAYGSTTPIQTLNPGGTPTGCSIDKTTGNLAVADFGAGQIAVFAGATGTPTFYAWATTPYPEYVAYDNAGNLFIGGRSSDVTHGVLGELPSGGSSINDLTLSGFSLAFGGNLQWGGTYLLVGDHGTAAAPAPSYVYQTTVSGTTVTAHSQLTFPGATEITGYWKTGAVPNAHIAGADYGAGNVQVDTFPAMSTIATVTSGISAPFGATVSR